MKGLLHMRMTREWGAPADKGGASVGRVQWKSSVMRYASSMTCTCPGLKGAARSPLLDLFIDRFSGVVR